MKKLILCSTKDLLNGYAAPVPFMSEELGKRYFKDLMLGNPTMKNTPEDFEFYKIGEFYIETGKIETCEPVRLEKGVNIIGN